MALIMGILNLTPDSFWEPSRHAYSVLASGADIIDVGAVSTRPGADPVSLEEEWCRLEPFLKTLSDDRPALSIDTTRAEIVRRAYECIGTFIVNDISAGEDDPEMLPLVGDLGLQYIAMHKRGTPKTMDGLAQYDNIVEDILQYFKEFEERAETAGLAGWILDPGLGFAKTEDQNWEILENLERLKTLGHPVLVGASNKRFTRGDTDRAHAVALRHGADILRVHDVPRARELNNLLSLQSL